LIARVWTARTTRERASKYAEYFRDHVLPELRRHEGHAAAFLLERQAAASVEVQVITFWRSLDAIRAFSGDDVEVAVVSETAAALLDDYDRRVRHFTVVGSQPCPSIGAQGTPSEVEG
jgi:heme-degrading monooxygenase HmoA